MRPFDSRELWRNRVAKIEEDAIDAAARVPVTHAERELAAKNIDVAARRAKAVAVVDRLAASEGPDAALGRKDASAVVALASWQRSVAEKSAKGPDDDRSDPAIESAGWVGAAQVTRLLS